MTACSERSGYKNLYRWLNQEVNEVQKRIDSTKAGMEKVVRLIPHHATSVEDINKMIADNDPQILHFSGHGEKNFLVFEDKDGISQPASLKDFAKTLETMNERSKLTKKDKIRCVVLAACHSERIAKAMARHIDVVIGWDKRLDSDVAEFFNKEFYYYLCTRHSFGDAFKIAENSMRLSGLARAAKPKLKSKKEVDPKTVFLFAPPKTESMVQDLMERYRNLQRRNVPDVKEFWDADWGLCQVLLYFQDNYEELKIPSKKRTQIGTIISRIPPMVRDWEISQPNPDPKLEGNIRQHYGVAMRVLNEIIQGK